MSSTFPGFRTEKGVTTVSINEVRLAIENGIESSKIIFNGNGKTKIELLKAINYGVIINVDSKFDYDNLLEAKGNVSLSSFRLTRQSICIK